MKLSNTLQALPYQSKAANFTSGHAAQTDRRTQILKTIKVLQTQLRSLHKELIAIGDGPDKTDLRLQLLRQINAVESEIAALQDELKTEEANKKVTEADVAAGGIGGNTKSSFSYQQQPSSSPANSTYSSTGKPQKDNEFAIGTTVDSQS